jgi:hypothetical protein
MKNWEIVKANYWRLDRPQQLGNLASSLQRIQTNLQFQDEPGDQIALAAIEECQRFTEWIVTALNLQADESDFNLAEMLLQLGRQISQWKFAWQVYRQNEVKRAEMMAIAQQWDKKMLEQSGLLQVKG